MAENKRAVKGTEHTLVSSNKIGGEFKKEENAPFIKERAELWDKLYSAQEEKNKNNSSRWKRSRRNIKCNNSISNSRKTYKKIRIKRIFSC